jgi:queuine/archaeosine tRNA-ribosyltransferase
VITIHNLKEYLKHRQEIKEALSEDNPSFW